MNIHRVLEQMQSLYEPAIASAPAAFTANPFAWGNGYACPAQQWLYQQAFAQAQAAQQQQRRLPDLFSILN